MSLYLSIGCKNMLCTNFYTEKGLVNGILEYDDNNGPPDQITFLIMVFN